LSYSRWNHITDNEILQRYYSDEDNEWLGILLQRYTILLLGVCMKYLKNEDDARDAVQQVFLKVINDLPKYKVEYFKSWLYMVAKNHCLMKLRGNGKKTTELNEQIFTKAENNEEIGSAVEKEVSLSNMEQALAQLNNEQKLCVTLFYLQKQSYQQIAGSTGFSTMQVKSHIQNGKRNLKILMQRMQPNE